MATPACRVEVETTQYLNQQAALDDAAEALYRECQEVVDNEPVEDIYVELFGDKALDRMGEWQTNLFKTKAKDLPAVVEARKIYLRDELIKARGES